MASDEELARHVAQQEGEGASAPEDDPPATVELDEYRATAGEIHDELARRIDRVDDESVDQESFTDVVDRLDRLESRLDDLESRLQE